MTCIHTYIYLCVIVWFHYYIDKGLEMPSDTLRNSSIQAKAKLVSQPQRRTGPPTLPTVADRVNARNVRGGSTH